MKYRFMVSVRIILASFVLYGTSLAEEDTEWSPFDECQERPRPGEPGGSRETAINVDRFEDLLSFSMHQAETWDEPEWEESSGYFAPSCKWVRLSGNFRSSSYYNYEGQLYRDAPIFYAQGEVVGATIPHYYVENFLSGDTHPADFHGRDISVTGLFINLCGALDSKLERENAELLARDPDATPEIGFYFGPCHYGKYTGLILHDVVVEGTASAPKFAAGESNYGIIGDLDLYQGEDIDGVVAKTKEWIAFVKAGPEVFKRAIVEGQAACEYDKGEPNSDYCKRILDLAAGPRSIAVFLHRQDLLRDIAPLDADIRVFRGRLYYGCVCLADDCTNRWPLFDRDARFAVNPYACAKITGDDGKWEILR